MENSFDVSSLAKYDWFYSYENGTLYVHYMNDKVFSLVPQNIILHYAASITFNKESYCTFIDLS